MAARARPEFIGMIQPRPQSEIHPADKSVVLDRGYLKAFAEAHEQGGFDRVLVGYYSDAPEGLLIGGYVAEQTERLGLLIAHRPGFVAPTLAARAFGTLDQLSGGRVAIHVISGGDDTDQRRDGDSRSLGGGSPIGKSSATATFRFRRPDIAWLVRPMSARWHAPSAAARIP